MTDFNLLFARDPLKHTTEDVTLIIEKFREMRVSFVGGNKTAGKTSPPKLTEKEKEVKSSGLSLKLDLGGLK